MSNHEIQQLPLADKRVETGPVQFGSDWPGYFERGDNIAGEFFMNQSMVNMAIKNLEEEHLPDNVKQTIIRMGMNFLNNAENKMQCITNDIWKQSVAELKEKLLSHQPS